MKNKKITFWTIIVLLIIFVPTAIYGTVKHFQGTHVEEENPNHDFKYNGKLYFYNQDTLVGTYTCNYVNNCNLAKTSTKSESSLAEPVSEENQELPVIKNRYAFLTDTNQKEEGLISLYDIELQRVIGTYKQVKNYGIGIVGDYYILQNDDDLWGVISFKNGVNVHIPFQYDYIGLANHIDENENKISSGVFAVYRENSWQLIGADGATYTETLAEDLFSYNNEYIVIKLENQMKLMDYKERVYLENLNYINFYNKYLEIIDLNSNFYLYNLSTSEQVSQMYPVTSIEDIELVTDYDEIQVNYKGSLEEIIAIE